MLKKFVFTLCFLIIGGLFPGKVVMAKEGLSEDRIVSLINDERDKVGLSELIINQKLNLAAKNKAEDMIKKQYWSHNSPDGLTPWVFIKKTGYSYRFAGENLAKGFRSEESLVDGWMNSELHRKNLLNKNYEEIGVANIKGNLLGEEVTLTVMIVAKRQKPIKEYWKELGNLFQNRPNWLAVSVD